MKWSRCLLLLLLVRVILTPPPDDVISCHLHSYTALTCSTAARMVLLSGAALLQQCDSAVSVNGECSEQCPLAVEPKHCSPADISVVPIVLLQ